MGLGEMSPGLKDRAFLTATVLGGGLLSLAVAGCALRSGSSPELVQKAAPELPADFGESAPPGAYAPAKWWRAFADPVLDEVVESVLSSNLSVVEAVARVEQARTRARLAGAAILPTVGARAGVDVTDQPTNAAIGAQLDELGLDFPLPDRIGITTWSLGADFAYEADFWGRVRHTSLAAGSELLASESDLQAAHMAVLAQTIAAYFEIGHLRQQLGIARRQMETLEERERLVANRYERGLAHSLELKGVRQALRGAESGIPQIENQLAEAESGLATLLGGYREDVAAILPDSRGAEITPDPVPAGIPADLLLQRPDVQAAGHRLEAAAHTVEARRAALMPQLSISGSIGLLSTEVGGLFDVKQWFTNLTSNLLRPVFDGGRLANNVRLAEARFDELAAAYGQTVVSAVNEVEAALATLRNEGRRRESLAVQHDEAQASMDLQSRRYVSGVGAYDDVLDAGGNLLEVESAVAGSERNLALARLAIHRALGGAWTSRDELTAAADAGVPGKGTVER